MRPHDDWIIEELPEFDELGDWAALPAGMKPIPDTRGDDMVFRGLLETDAPPDSTWQT